MSELRILVVYAHPLETSFIAALHLRAVETLRAGWHSVDDLDLYAERFDPVMSREQFAHYVDARVNTREVESYVKRLRAAEALVMVFPVWFDGLPAMMQGYFQRVFLPGVALRIDESGLFHPTLWHLKRMAAVCTYGESRRDVAANSVRELLRMRRFNSTAVAGGAFSTCATIAPMAPPEDTISTCPSGNGAVAARFEAPPADAAVIPECTGVEAIVSTPPVLWVRVTVRGRPAYVGRPGAYVNAVERATELIASLREVAAGSAGAGATLSIGVIDGGDWPSTVPLECSFTCRVSTPSDWTVERAMREVEAWIEAEMRRLDPQAYGLAP